MAKYSIEDSTLTGIADAIREKEGTTDAIPVVDFAARIAAIEGNGGGKKLSELTEGSLISVLEDGKLVPFYVAKHDYEADLNGEGRTLLVRKEAYGTKEWNSSGANIYAYSTIDTWFNGDFLNCLSAVVRGLVGTTTFKCTIGGGDATISTLTRAVFGLSITECGLSDPAAGIEGSALPIASALRVAKYNGSAIIQWTRTAYKADNTSAYYVNANGAIGGYSYRVTNAFYARPCFTLPANMALNTEPYGDGSWGLADEDVLFDTTTAKTTPLAPVNYTNGIADLTPAQLHEIAAAISANPNITKYSSVVYYDKGDVHRKISVGDQTTTDVGGTDYAFDIIGFNHDDLSLGTEYGGATATGKAGMTFQMHDCWVHPNNMNYNHTNSGGWTSSAMRTIHLANALPTMSADIQNVIKSVNKLTSAGNNSSTITITADKLFLLSEIEVFGVATNSYVGEGSQYAYYKAGNSTIKHINGEAKMWWERSPVSTNNQYFCGVSGSGAAIGFTGAAHANGVAFAYCI